MHDSNNSSNSSFGNNRSIFKDIETETINKTNLNLDAVNNGSLNTTNIVLIIGSVLLGCYFIFTEPVNDSMPQLFEESAPAQKKQYGISKVSPEPLEANPQQSPITNVLNNAYSGYSDRKECWIAQMPENNLRYCVKIDNEKIITHNNIKRYYIMTRGIAIDENENDSQIHSLPGIVGSFVMEERNNKLEILASDSKFYLGSYGTGPEKWTLVKLGPDNYWGWQNISGDCHQGYCGNRFHLLAPFKKEIRDLAGFISNYDSSGTCSDSEPECSDKISLINTDIKIDSSKTSEKIFPLQILVSGKENGQIIEPYLLNLNFDRKKWTYPLPNDYLMNDKEY